MNVRSLICGVCLLCLLFNSIPSIDVEAKTTKISTIKEVRPKSSFIYYSKDETLNRKLQVYIDEVPDEILYAIQSIGYRISVVEIPKGLSGYTDSSKKRIYISKNIKDFKVVIHKIAHAYDDYLGWISNSKEFQEVYNIEKKLFNEI